jgi:carboxyl-terminal processing protease
VSTSGRAPDADAEFRDDSPQRWPELPVVVLVDSGTASAAEIVAGALHDHGRAVLVGSQTYGKGSAQSVFPLMGGRALKLTTARWFTPEGTSIQQDSAGKGGITPDIDLTEHPRTERSAALVDEAMARALRLLDGVMTRDELRDRLRDEH